MQGFIGNCISESLLIHKIPPSSESLTYRKTRCGNIKKQTQLLLAYSAANKKSEHAAYYAAVYSQPAVADSEYIRYCLKMMIGIKYHIIKPCKYYCKYHGPYYHIRRKVARQFTAFCIQRCQKKARKHAYCNNYSVPINVSAEQLECHIVNIATRSEYIIEKRADGKQRHLYTFLFVSEIN